MALTILFTGCERRELVRNNASINIRLDLQLNVKVNGKIEALPTPEMMRVMFFDYETFDLITESYLPAGGGNVSIPPGRYKLIVYNFDTETTLLRNDRNYYSIEAYTNEIPTSMRSAILNSIQYSIPASKGGSDDTDWDKLLSKVQSNPIVYEPDHLFVSHEEIEVLNIEGEQVIEASAETIVETWEIFVNIKNEQYIASARALLTGQIGSNFIGLPKEEGKTDTDVTLMFDMEPEDEEGENHVIASKFNTFGKNPSVDSRLWLTIIIKTTGGDILEWHRDITDEFFMDEALENNTIHIQDEIDVPIPENPQGGGGGFQPGVEDWEEENIPIEI